MKGIKRLVIASLITFISAGVFSNSSFYNEKKDEAYAELKEKYSFSSDINTKEEIIKEEKEHSEEEEIKQETQAVSVADNRTTEEIVWDYLIAHGYSKVQVAGIIGNMYQESGLKPDRVETNGIGIGLVQWSFGRRQSLESFAASRGTIWQDINIQLEFLVSELNSNQFTGRYKKEFDSKEATVEDTTSAFCWGFERPNKKKANLSYRVKKAEEVYARNIDR